MVEVYMEAKSHCEICKLRRYSETKPNSIIAKIWGWHKKWCPGWKAYQRELAGKHEGPDAD